MRPQTLAGTLLVAFLTLAATASYISHLRNQRDDALAAQTQIKLEAEGYKKALLVKPTEVTKLVPTLVTKYIEREVKAGTIQPVAAGHIEGHTSIYVPCPTETEPILDSYEPQKGTDVKLTVVGNFLITRIRFGEAVSWKGDLGGDADINGAHTPLTFKPEDIQFDVRVSQDIATALRDHEREGGWLRRHTALACPAGGLAVDPFDGKVTAAVTCAYGFVWF